MHPAESLWAQHHPPSGYPSGVIPVPEPIPGLAFFPGGYGLWGTVRGEPLPMFPVGGIMVLGHDFHSEEGYAKSLRRGSERTKMPTWRNLLKLLDAAGVQRERCFFTNLYMGLRKGAATTGEFPGAGDQAFVTHCKAFLSQQIDVQRPALLITLGVHVPKVLGSMSPALAAWTEGNGLKHLDAVGPLQSGVTFPAVPNFETTVVALIHPSLRHASLRHRRGDAPVGTDPEIPLLRRGLSAGEREH